MKIDEIGAVIARTWANHQDAIVMGAAAVIALLLAYMAWRFWKAKERSKAATTLAAILVLGWESEGVLNTALYTHKVPVGFAVISFVVFEALLVAAVSKAEENRREKGMPGPAGPYAFLIAEAAGLYAALGEATLAGVYMRVGLPALALGFWWISLVGDRITDTAEIKALRKKHAEEREATWVYTPRSLAIKVGLMKPGKAKTTDAQRDYDIARMVTYGIRVWAGTWPRAWHQWRLNVITRNADKDAVVEAAEKVERTTNIRQLLLPNGTRADQAAAAARRASARADTRTPDRTPDQAPGHLVGQADGRAPEQDERTPGRTPEHLVGQADGRAPDRPDTSDGQAPGHPDKGDRPAPFPTTDAGLIERLRKMDRRADGTVSVEDARRAITPPGAETTPGRGRTTSLLKRAGMYRDPATGQPWVDPSAAPAADAPELEALRSWAAGEDLKGASPLKVNGEVPSLSGASSAAAE